MLVHILLVKFIVDIGAIVSFTSDTMLSLICKIVLFIVCTGDLFAELLGSLHCLVQDR